MPPPTVSWRKLPEFWRYLFFGRVCWIFFGKGEPQRQLFLFRQVSALLLPAVCEFRHISTALQKYKRKAGGSMKCWLIMYLLSIYVDINILQIYIFFLTSILYLSYCLLFVVFYTYCPLGTIVQWKKRLGPYAICKVLQIPNENNCKLFVSRGRCTLTQHPKAFKNLPGYEK